MGTKALIDTRQGDLLAALKKEKWYKSLKRHFSGNHILIASIIIIIIKNK